MNKTEISAYFFAPKLGFRKIIQIIVKIIIWRTNPSYLEQLLNLATTSYPSRKGFSVTPKLYTISDILTGCHSLWLAGRSSVTNELEQKSKQLIKIIQMSTMDCSNLFHFTLLHFTMLPSACIAKPILSSSPTGPLGGLP